MNVKYMYKIHCLNVANGISRSAGNDTFYATEEQALEQARQYVNYDHGNNEMIVYRAAFLVRRIEAPVEIIPLDREPR